MSGAMFPFQIKESTTTENVCKSSNTGIALTIKMQRRPLGFPTHQKTIIAKVSSHSIQIQTTTKLIQAWLFATHWMRMLLAEHSVLKEWLLQFPCRQVIHLPSSQ
jgi:hypothetical protein